MKKSGVMKRIYYSDIFRIALISLLIITTVIVVYLTDGTGNVYLQFFYIPIMLGAYFFGMKGGAAAGAVCGILIGPAMPLSVSQGIMQSTGNWVIRLLIYTASGLIYGYFFALAIRLDQDLRSKDFISAITGYYNTTRLLMDLENRMGGGEFSLISVNMINIEEIEQYSDYRFAVGIIRDIIAELGCKRRTVYTGGINEIFLIDKRGGGLDGRLRAVVKKYSNTVRKDRITFRLILKAGIYEYVGGDVNPMALVVRARVAQEQGEAFKSGIYYYKPELEERKRDRYEISVSLPGAIKKGELYLVYQPQIRLSDNHIIGVEALIRWRRGAKKPFGPVEFIKIAEDIGFINEISLFVMGEASDRLSGWHKKGIVISCSVNFASGELLDEDFIARVIGFMAHKQHIQPYLGIELTERVVSPGNVKLMGLLKELQGMGYKLYIDDFGTGFNSLLTVGEISFDVLKIDKYFIDRLDRPEISQLVKSIIDYTHYLGRTVVAEGVETSEQARILKKLGCDAAQGFFFCKPLEPEELELFYKQHTALSGEEGTMWLDKERSGAV
ncbi:MAG: EAL domain-containing protein [Eubacteriales bacterium]|nr:EAL domain-containing protein [Eubacteriales bacterium]